MIWFSVGERMEQDERIADLAERLRRDAEPPSGRPGSAFYAAADAVRPRATAEYLALFLGDWERWAITADRRENGWEVDYPQMDLLLGLAEGVMLAAPTDPATLRDLDRCWELTEEDELLAEFARDHLDRCRPTLRWLIAHGRHDARWQAADVLGDDIGNPEAEALLRAALDDPEEYVRRRAFLALARHAPPDARALTERFFAIPDYYSRRSAIQMALATGDATFIVEIRRAFCHHYVGGVRTWERSGALDVARESGDGALIAEIRRALWDDPEGWLREAARRD